MMNETKPMNLIPWPHQTRTVFEIERIHRLGKNRILTVAPTGAGKTMIAGMVALKEISEGRTAIMIAHRTELIAQASRKADEIGIAHGIIQAGNPRIDYSLPFQIGSIQTISARMAKGARRNRNYIPMDYDLVITDECHRALGATYEAFYAAVRAVRPMMLHIGLTATPWRSDNRGLAQGYDALVHAATIPALIADGYLVPPRAFIGVPPDLFGVAIDRTTGDYDEGQLAAVMGRNKIVGDAVDSYLKHARGRRAIAFCASVDHSRAVAGEFTRRGIPAEHLDGETEPEIRAAILARLESGETMIVSNYAVLTEGFDCPAVSCIIALRPSKSLGVVLQMAGRGLRCHAASGKQDCIILDHSGWSIEHGPVDIDRKITLEWGVSKSDGGEDSEPDLDRMIRCQNPKCGARFKRADAEVIDRRIICPSCGMPANQRRPPQIVDGELREFTSEEIIALREAKAAA